MKDLKNDIKSIFIIALSAIFLYSGINIVIYFYDGYSNEALNESLQNAYHKFDYDDNTLANSPESVTHEYERYADRFENLLQVNEEVVGWINIPGTQIDYPVVQTDNNEFYLNRNFKRQMSSHGTVFMDYRNSKDVKDYNTVLYGHHMKDGTMFADLSSYKERSFYLDHPYIKYDSLEQPMKWKVFSVYIYQSGADALLTSFDNDEEYAQYLNTIINNSLYKTGVNVTKDDRILTLITCSYEYSNARLVVHAKIE